MRFKIGKQKLTLIIKMLVCTLAVFCFPINNVKAEDYISDSLLNW